MQSDSGSAPAGAAPDASTETDAQKLARLEAENAELKQGAASNVEPGSAAADAPADIAAVNAPAQAPLQALANSVSQNPELTFVEHLQKLGQDGIKAVVSPQIQEDVMGVLTALVADIVKVKL